jgi:hypothetical protein
MDFDKYIEIKEKYGNESSWAIWSEMLDTNTSNMSDISFFDDKNIYKELNPQIIMVGLNISEPLSGKSFSNFHGKGGGAYKLRYGLKDTPCWGAYLTDIIKNFPEPDSNKVLKHLKENPDFLEENINLFRDELSDLGSVNPRVYAFGDAAFKILDDIPEKEFTLTKLIHYSYRFQGFSNQETYKKYLHEQIYG